MKYDVADYKRNWYTYPLYNWTGETLNERLDGVVTFIDRKIGASYCIDFCVCYAQLDGPIDSQRSSATLETYFSPWESPLSLIANSKVGQLTHAGFDFLPIIEGFKRE